MTPNDLHLATLNELIWHEKATTRILADYSQLLLDIRKAIHDKRTTPGTHSGHTSAPTHAHASRDAYLA